MAEVLLSVFLLQEVPTFLIIGILILVLTSPHFWSPCPQEPQLAACGWDNSRRGMYISHILNKKCETFFQEILFCVMISFHIIQTPEAQLIHKMGATFIGL